MLSPLVSTVAFRGIKMAYMILENNQPIDSYGIGDWNKSIFEDWDDAVLHAHRWAYPHEFETIKDCFIPMVENFPVDMSMCEIPVMIEIRKIENDGDL